MSGYKIQKMAVDLVTKTFKYFSYGSNLLRERILVNNPSAKVFGIGKLSGYKFAFDTPLGHMVNGWNGAVATIRPGEATDAVYGVIWDLHLDDLKSLDKQERLYDPLEVKVEDFSGQTVICRTYAMQKDTENYSLPSPYYKKVVIDGAKQNALPSEYIEFLESLPDNGRTDIPAVYQEVLKIMEKFRNEESH